MQLLDALGRTVRTARLAPHAQVSVQGLLPGLHTLHATTPQGTRLPRKMVVE